MRAPRILRRDHDHPHGRIVGKLVPGLDARLARRKVPELVDDARVRVDLARTVPPADRGVPVREDAGEIRVRAEPEPPIEMRGDPLHRLARHVGNRHTPCQMDADRLPIRRGNVIRDMRARLVAGRRDVPEPFTHAGDRAERRDFPGFGLSRAGCGRTGRARRSVPCRPRRAGRRVIEALVQARLTGGPDNLQSSTFMADITVMWHKTLRAKALRA